jgi:NitT/TauT family transport system substrate-binding protein
MTSPVLLAEPCLMDLSRLHRDAASLDAGRRRLLRGVAATATLPAWPALAAPSPLLVGGLPVTCNLTLPVACTARAAAGSVPFEYSKYNGWPEVRSR